MRQQESQEMRQPESQGVKTKPESQELMRQPES